MKRQRLGVSLPADLVAYVRAAAAKEGRTLSAIVEDALRARQAVEQWRQG